MARRSDFGVVLAIWEQVLIAASDFHGELFRLCNPNSYLDCKVYLEMLVEITDARDELLEAVYRFHGWTGPEFEDALYRSTTAL